MTVSRRKGGDGMVHIGNDWDAILADEWGKEYYLALLSQHGMTPIEW